MNKEYSEWATLAKPAKKGLKRQLRAVPMIHWLRSHSDPRHASEGANVFRAMRGQTSGKSKAG